MAGFVIATVTLVQLYFVVDRLNVPVKSIPVKTLVFTPAHKSDLFKVGGGHTIPVTTELHMFGQSSILMLG